MFSFRKHRSSSSTASAGGPLLGRHYTFNGVTVCVSRKIADGGFGIVYIAFDECNRSYALKSIVIRGDEHLQQIEREYRFQEQCKDANVVQVYGMIHDAAQGIAMILMEYCPNALVDEMNRFFDVGFNTEKIVRIFQDICSAVSTLHEKEPKIIHRDLKPENVLMGEGAWKLCDFGSATDVVYDLSTNHGLKSVAEDDIYRNTTQAYRAPEMCDLFRFQRISEKIDVWALGCVLFKLCTFKDAFGEGNNLQILNKKYFWPENRSVDSKLKELVEYCFEPDPEKRPSVRMVLGKLQNMFPRFVDRKWKLNGAEGNSNSVQQNNEMQVNNGVEQNDPFKDFEFQDNDEVQEIPKPEMSFQQTTYRQQNGMRRNRTRSFENSNVYQCDKTNNRRNRKRFSQCPNYQNNKFQSSICQNNYNQFNRNYQNQFNNAFEKQNYQQQNYMNQKYPYNYQNTCNDRIIVEQIFLFHKMLSMTNQKLSRCLFNFYNYNPQIFPVFMLSFIHESKEHVTRLLSMIPQTNDNAFENLICSRIKLQNEFPWFEGNYSLFSFIQSRKARIGTPPFCVDTIKSLHVHLSISIHSTAIKFEKEYAHEVYLVYQVLVYIISKLKQQQYEIDFLENISIPLLKTQYDQIIQFVSDIPDIDFLPKGFFDFDNPICLQRIHPPLPK